jgi:hypothetical protein
LQWEDFELRFQAGDVQSGVRRLPVFVEAINRCLAIALAKPARREIALRKRLASELGRIERVEVRSQVKIAVSDLQTVRVDYEVRRNGTRAAVEVLGGKTDSGSAISVDRAVANFQVLRYHDYQGRMIGVYDEDSPAGRIELRRRFEQAAPEKTLLVSGARAAEAIQGALFSGT